MQSQLRVCSIDRISKWYKDLPDLLYSEVNDIYCVKIQCLEIEYIMLTAIFADHKECSDITYVPIKRKYDTKTRCKWLTEASNSTGVSLPNIPEYSVSTTTDADSHKTSVLNALDSFIKNMCTDHKAQVNIVLTTLNDYSKSIQMVSSDDDIIFVIDNTSENLAVEFNGCLAVRATEDRVVSLIQQWIDITILYPYMMFCYSKLTNTGKNSSFFVRARLQMLTQDEPIAEIKMPAKLECGHSSNIILDEFPASNLTIRSSDPSVVSIQNGTVKALKTGSAQIEIISETGTVLCKQLISVYFVPRVTSVSLSVVNGTSVLQGAQFCVNAKYTPSNAVNISNTRWSFSPASSLRTVGMGNFEALNPGPCTITVQVDNVVQSIVVQIIPLPKRIKMTSEIRMKLNAAPAPFHATLEPIGSGCNGMSVQILDTSIARWNQTNKTVVAINEGNTVLEVSAIDAKGNTILRQNCKVTILPEKDIITPPTYPTIIVVCAILAIITATTIMSLLAAVCGGIVSVLEIIQNIRPVLQKNSTKQNKIELGIGIAGILGCILIILFYMGLV